MCRSVLALAAVFLLAGCGSSSTTTTGAVDGPALQGLILRPAKLAPPLALHNYTGQPVNIQGFRGKAVLVTFVYTHCPDVCPLIVSSLAVAQKQLGAEANRVQILAVTIDPRHDTPSAIRQFLAERDATGRMDYLLGSPSQLARAWRAWGVAVTVDANKTIAGHSAVIYGITATGRMAVAYPSNVTPAQIVHDVPLLAQS